MSAQAFLPAGANVAQLRERQQPADSATHTADDYNSRSTLTGALMLRLSAPPEVGPSGRRVANEEWADRLYLQASAIKGASETIEVDISNLDFVTLFGWTTAVSYIRRIASDKAVDKITLDVIGDQPFTPLPDAARDARHGLAGSRDDQTRSRYRLAAFLESLNTSAILRRESTSVAFLKMHRQDIDRFAHRSDPTGEQTVVLPLCKAASFEACSQFADAHQINVWRRSMGARFAGAEIFGSEELWRLLCYELAVNSVEHAAGTGLLTARAIVPSASAISGTKRWVDSTFGPLFGGVLPNHYNEGFVELCVCDAGPGFAATLGRALMAIQNTTDTSPTDILAFAFDARGTRKSNDDSWLTERHALSRVLALVATYGGMLRIRSDGTELLYRTDTSNLTRRRGLPGYEPTENRTFAVTAGAQLQLLLPLRPRANLAHRNTTSVLTRSLPETFRIEQRHPKGHLVPLFESLLPYSSSPTIDATGFKRKCHDLCSQLLALPQTEPVVFDFSGINWTPPQFETFIVLVQALLVDKPVLLIELSPALARAVKHAERSALATTLPASASGPWSHFLEPALHGHTCVLALDASGNPYLFGISNEAVEQKLLDLQVRPRSLGELTADRSVTASQLEGYLAAPNGLFRQENGVWQCVWLEIDLQVESRRAMSRHFDFVARRTGAWRGATHRGAAKSAFHLSWLGEWRDDFLETSRILVRQREADELAQRLIVRLEHGLGLLGYDLSQVDSLACVTAPSALLAAALYRWWPARLSRPTVADFGFYVLMRREEETPSIPGVRRAVIVQDVLDRGRVLQRLQSTLSRQRIEILASLSLVRFIDPGSATRVSDFDEGWIAETPSRVPTHALFEVARPRQLSEREALERITYWIEPRSLRPVKYSTLRRDFEERRDPDLQQRDNALRLLAEGPEGCLMSAGHYVYGARHFSVAADMRRALSGTVGRLLASWIADVCEGHATRQRAPWEKEQSEQMRGDVTLTLMPLHSHIHYLWPMVQAELSLRNRRAPFWLLGATSFTGRGPEYFIPDQVRNRIDAATRSAAAGHPQPLRVLILDDAAATGRTAEAIIATLMRHVRVALLRHSVDERRGAEVIQWIRYFVVLNQMGHQQHMFWRGIRAVGGGDIPFAFEAMAPFMGSPVYESSNCPECADYFRLERLAMAAEREYTDTTVNWLASSVRRLAPVALDAGTQHSAPHRTSRPLEIVPHNGERERRTNAYYPHHADAAIWRFYDSMYASSPPSDALKSLVANWSTDPVEAEECRRYRQAVITWCFRHWPRVLADGARHLVQEAVQREIDFSTASIEECAIGAARLVGDEFGSRVGSILIDTLATLEGQRGQPAYDTEASKRAIQLERAVSLFFLAAAEGASSDPSRLNMNALRALVLERAQNAGENSFIRQIAARLRRASSDDAAWALEVLAELIFRGRANNVSIEAEHQLLRKLLRQVLTGSATPETLHMLQGAVGLFIAALEQLHTYETLGTHALQLAKGIRQWLLKIDLSAELATFPNALAQLSDEMSESGGFGDEFERIFHWRLSRLKRALEDHAAQYPRLDFSVTSEVDLESSYALTDMNRLVNALSNFGVDPAKDIADKSQTRVAISRSRDRLTFRILTSFSDQAEAHERIEKGRHSAADVRILKQYGGSFDEVELTPLEAVEGFSAAFHITTLAGFSPRRNGDVSRSASRR